MPGSSGSRNGNSSVSCDARYLVAVGTMEGKMTKFIRIAGAVAFGIWQNDPAAGIFMFCLLHLLRGVRWGLK